MDTIIVGIEAMRIGRKSSICCLRIAECEPATPRIVPAELEENRVFDLWGAAQHDIWRAWMVETDPANLQPKLRPLNRQSRRIHPRHLPVPRPRHPRHRLRTALPASQEDQHIHRARRPTPRHQGGRRGHLARELHALRSWILRSGAENLAAPRQPVRHEVVTHVLGTNCYPCVRAGQGRWRRGWDSNPRYAFTYTRVPGVRLKPLGHLSAGALLCRASGAFSSETVGPSRAGAPVALRTRGSAHVCHCRTGNLRRKRPLAGRD